MIFFTAFPHPILRNRAPFYSAEALSDVTWIVGFIQVNFDVSGPSPFRKTHGD